MSAVYKTCEGCPFSEETRFIGINDCEGPTRFVNQPENVEPSTGRVRGPTRGYSVGQIACSRELKGQAVVNDREILSAYAELSSVAEDDTIMQMTVQAWDETESGLSLFVQTMEGSVQPEVDRAKGGMDEAISCIQDVFNYERAFQSLAKSIARTFDQGGTVTVEAVKFRKYKDEVNSIRSAKPTMKDVSIENIAHELHIVYENCIAAGGVLLQIESVEEKRNAFVNAAVDDKLDYHKKQLFNESRHVGGFASDAVEKIKNAVAAMKEIKL